MQEKKKVAWITCFEDVTEDRCKDPSKDKDYTKKEPSISFIQLSPITITFNTYEIVLCSAVSAIVFGCNTCPW